MQEKAGIVYLGLIFATIHTEQLSARLEHDIMQRMVNESDALYSAKLVGALAAPDVAPNCPASKAAAAPKRGRKRSRPEQPTVGKDGPEDGNDQTLRLRGGTR